MAKGEPRTIFEWIRDADTAVYKERGAARLLAERVNVDNPDDERAAPDKG